MNKNFINGFLKLFNSSLKLLFIFFIASFLSEGVVGKYGIIASIIPMVVIFMGGDVYYYYHREYAKSNGLNLSNQFATYLIIYFIVMPVAFFMLFEKFGLLIAIVVVAIAIFEHLSDEFSRLLILKDKQLDATFTTLIKGSLWVVILIPVFYMIESIQTLEVVLLVWLVFSIFATIYSYFVIRSIKNGEVFFSSISNKEMIIGIKVGLIYLISSLSAKVIFSIDKIYLERYVSLEVAGIYFIYFGLAMGALGLLEPIIVSFIYPKLLSASQEDEKIIISKKLICYSVLYLFLSSIILVFSAKYVFILFGMDKYILNYEYFIFVVFMVCNILFSRIPNLLLFSIGCDRINSGVSIISTMFCVVLLWISPLDNYVYNLIFSVTISFLLLSLIRLLIFYVNFIWDAA
ncbi:hypothetical protein [Vibrio vulnificus]|uniref:hypothetical protein n=1 Tax=Vibrio vulnificus TaxID=672 RepID=UPI003EDB0AB2